jgi:hypothetical protein
MCNRANPADRRSLEIVNMIHLEFLLGHQLCPVFACGGDIGIRHRPNVPHVGRLYTAAVRVVAFEMGGVDLDFFGIAGRAQCDDDPVIAGSPTTAGFPTVTHVQAAPRGQDDPGIAIMRVAVPDNPPCIDDGRQFVMPGRVLAFPFADGCSPDAEAGDAAIRKNVEPQDVVGSLVVDREKVLGVPQEISVQTVCSSGNPSISAPSIDANGG